MFLCSAPYGNKLSIPALRHGWMHLLRSVIGWIRAISYQQSLLVHTYLLVLEEAEYPIFRIISNSFPSTQCATSTV